MSGVNFAIIDLFQHNLFKYNIFLFVSEFNTEKYGIRLKLRLNMKNIKSLFYSITLEVLLIQ